MIEVMKNKIKKLDLIIPYLLFPLLIFDMLNGLLYENEIQFFMSVSQLYKLVIVFLFCLRLTVNSKVFKIILFYCCLLFIPTLVQIFFYEASLSLLFNDAIRTSKYLIIIISFFYFKDFLSDIKNKFGIILKWMKFSFWVVALNLLIKIIGLGYPMYETGNIGTRGYFIAGNEISALLIVLSAFIGYYYLVVLKNSRIFVFYGVLSFILGLLISSKTGMLGIVLVYGAMLLSNYDYSKAISKGLLIKAIGGTVSVFCLIVLFVLNSSILDRYIAFWGKLDFMTFMLSSRNLYLEEILIIINENYSSVDYLIGVGPTKYYELATKFVEIDFIDIFFSYGVIGVLSLVYFYWRILKEAITIKRDNRSEFVTLSIVLLFFLLILSFLSGHILNSGIAGIYIGFTFAVMYYKKSHG